MNKIKVYFEFGDFKGALLQDGIPRSAAKMLHPLELEIVIAPGRLAADIVMKYDREFNLWLIGRP